MKISVIIPTMDRPDDLRRALASLMRQTRPAEEVIVVDQSADDRSRRVVHEILRAYPDRRIVWTHQEERSTVKARNYGVRLSDGDIVSFMDDDIVLFDDYLERVMRYFEDDASLGGVMGNVVVEHPASGWKWAMRKFLYRMFLVSNFEGRLTATGFGYPIYEREIQDPKLVELFSGYSMNFRRPFLVEDRFDEWFTGYSFREDVDLSYRISRRTKMMMVPDARFRHRNSSVNRLNQEALKRMEVKNTYYVFRKYRYRGFRSNFLFAYSLGGLILIDFIEFLTSLDGSKFRKFKVGLLSLVEILFRPGEAAASAKPTAG